MLHNRLRAASAAGGGGGGGGITDPSHPDLVAYYTMDNISGSTLVDETGNGNDATIIGATVVAGLIGDALDFDGVNDEARASAYPGSQLLDFSFGGWFYFDVDDLNINTLFAHQRLTGGSGNSENSGCFLNTVDNGLGRALHSNHVMLSTETNTDSNGNTMTAYVAIVFGATPLLPNNWYFLWYQLTNSGKTSQIYVDGALDGEVTSTQTIRYSSEGANSHEDLMRYSRYTGDTFYPTNGKVDQFRFFSRSLTPSEIAELYNGGSGA